MFPKSLYLQNKLGANACCYIPNNCLLLFIEVDVTSENTA